MRVLWLTENYPPSRGGMAQSCDRIVHSLRESGVIIDLLHFCRHLPKEKIETQKNGRYIGWPVIDSPPHALNCVWNWLAADPEIHSLTHVVAFGGLLPLQAGPIYSAWLKSPLITLIRGNDFDTALFTLRRGDILREALERSARVCVVSREKETKIKALYPDVRTVWIPNGIDLTEWDPLPSNLERAREWREKNGLNRIKVLGLFGHIKQKKGGLFFLENLLNSGFAASFHVLFVGELGEEVLHWLQTHENQLDYSLIPFTDRYELLTYYPACDFVVIPSFYDGMPNVLLEAAALGIPLLASRTGGMDDILVDGKHGFLFYPGNSEECRNAISRAATCADTEPMKIACRSLVRSHFPQELEAERHLAVLKETIQWKEEKASIDFS